MRWRRVLLWAIALGALAGLAGIVGPGRVIGPAAADPSPASGATDHSPEHARCEQRGGQWVQTAGAGGYCRGGTQQSGPSPQGPSQQERCEQQGGRWESGLHGGACRGGTFDELTRQEVCEAGGGHWSPGVGGGMCRGGRPGPDPSTQAGCQANGGTWRPDAGPRGACQEGIRCAYTPPFGQEGLEWSEAAGPGDVPAPTAGVVAETLRLFGLMDQQLTIRLPRSITTDRQYAWYMQELAGEGHCHLALTLPHPGCDRGPRSDPQSGPLPDDCWGQYPTRNYEIYYSGGGSLEITDKLWGWPMSMSFLIGRSATQIALGVVDEALSFDIVSGFVETVVKISDNVKDDLVVGLSLRQWAWLILIGYVAVAMVVGRLAAAAGQLVLTIFLLTLASVPLANPRGYMQLAADTMRGLSNQVMEVSASEDLEGECTSGRGLPTNIPDSDLGAAARDGAVRDPNLEALNPDLRERRNAEWCTRVVTRDMAQRIHRIFVEDPYDYINWGRILQPYSRHGPGDVCPSAYGVRNRILSTGGHGTHPWVRDYLREVGPQGWRRSLSEEQVERLTPKQRDSMRDAAYEECEALAAYNQKPSGERLTVALVTSAAAVAMAVLLGLISLTVFLAKVVVIVLFALAPLLATAAILPSGGRRLALRAATTGLQAGAVAVAMSFLLSLTILMLVPTFALVASRGPVQGYVMMLVPMVVMWIGRRSLLSGAKGIFDGSAERISRMSVIGAGAGFAGGGATARGASLFGAPRPENLAGGMAVATTGVTAAAAIGSAGARAARIGAKVGLMPVTAPGRLVLGRLKERRAANRMLQNNAMVELMLAKRNRLAGAVAGGGGARGGRRGTTYGVPSEMWQMMPRGVKRLRIRRHAEDRAIARYRRGHDRGWLSPVVEMGIRARTRFSYAVATRDQTTGRWRWGDHSVFGRGLANRRDRTYTPDPQVRFAPGRTRRLLRWYARHGAEQWR